MKKCFKCNEIKELSSFYKHKAMKDGHLNKCVDCTKKDVREREDSLKDNPEWIESEKKRHRDKYHRLNYKDKHKPTPEMKAKAMSNYNSKYPEKVRARNKSSHLKAEVKGNHLHHWSYAEGFEKDVIELTVKDHNLIHRFMEYEQKTMCYKAKLWDGELLNTKFKHLEYITFCFLTMKV
jgi:hypothetical protein